MHVVWEFTLKLTITTTYENVDQEWLDWWFDRLANEQVMPGSTVIVEELKECGHAVFTSKDPDSDVIGSTAYQVDKGFQPVEKEE